MFSTSWTIDIRINIQIWLLYRRYKSEWYNFWWATIQDIAACACKVWTLFGQACGQECSQMTMTTTDKSWLHRLATDILSWAKKIGPLDLSSWQLKQAQFTWVHWWKLLLWIDLLSCYSLILVYTWIYKYVYENMGMETFTINSRPVSDKWNFEYCKVAFSLPR